MSRGARVLRRLLAVVAAGLGETRLLGVRRGGEVDLGHRLVVPLAVRLVELHRVGVALDLEPGRRGAVLVRSGRTGTVATVGRVVWLAAGRLGTVDVRLPRVLRRRRLGVVRLRGGGV